MAKIKKRTKKYNPHKNAPVTMRIAETSLYWHNIGEVLCNDVPAMAVRQVSTDPISRELYDAIYQPLKLAVARFREQRAAFLDYWNLTNGMYLLAHVIQYVLEVEQLHFETEEQTQAFKQSYWKLFDTIHDVYAPTIDSIGSRHKRVGKYALSGDEYKQLIEMLLDTHQVLDWVSVRAINFAYESCVKNVAKIEKEILARKGI